MSDCDFEERLSGGFSDQRHPDETRPVVDEEHPLKTRPMDEVQTPSDRIYGENLNDVPLKKGWWNGRFGIMPAHVKEEPPPGERVGRPPADE